MVGAVELVTEAGVQAARNRNVSLSKRIARAAIERRRRSGCSSQRDKLSDVSSVQRQLENTGIFHDLAHAGIPRFHQSRVCFNFNLFADLPYFQRDIDGRARVDFQIYSGLNESAEARQLSFYFVWTNGKVRKNVRSRFI